MTRLALAFLALASLAACETMQGAGRDIENTGEALQSEAAQTQAEM
ncbi:MAG: entericidin A/B family lipoprotein [Defluviimonas sp.]|nr:entericidin A/B family lipoprotein [Defluviimonas sp.]